MPSHKGPGQGIRYRTQCKLLYRGTDKINIILVCSSLTNSSKYNAINLTRTKFVTAGVALLVHMLRFGSTLDLALDFLGEPLHRSCL